MGRKPRIWNDGFRGFCATATWDLFEAVSRKTVLLAFAALAACSSQAFEAIPFEAAKALGVTRGKPFTAGVVFVNGKYVDPPYVVERWGTGIRINSMPVTGQVVDWDDFLKTQDPSNLAKTEGSPAPAAAPAPAYTPPPAAERPCGPTGSATAARPAA